MGMNLKIDSIGRWVRMGIYATALMAYLFVGFKASVHAINENVNSQDPGTFWPPDMIPHPHPPQPKDDESKNWAKLEPSEEALLCMVYQRFFQDHPSPIGYLNRLDLTKMYGPPDRRFTSVDS